jgi:polyhydroxyalkanoate synthesis regulator phasin
MCLPNPLKRAFDHASCTAEGAQRLLTLLVPRLNAETYTEARAFCDELEAEAKKAQAAYLAGTEPATTEQKQNIISLSNHPLITRTEKTEMQHGLNQLTQQQATDRHAVYLKIIQSRNSTQYAVVAEAYKVAA